MSKTPRALQWLTIPRASLILLSLIVINWSLSLFQGLWIDEFGTYFVVRDGLTEAISRSWFRYSQSPFYYIVEWGFVQILGLSEPGLRALSLLTTILSLVLFWKSGKLLLDEEFAWISTLLFALTSEAHFAALSARPYGLILFFFSLALYALLMWRVTGRNLFGLLFPASLGGVVHCQWILIPYLPLLFCGFALPLKKTTRLKWGGFYFGSLVFSLVSLPVVFKIIEMWGLRQSLSWVNEPDLRWVSITAMKILPKTGLAFLLGLSSFLSAQAYMKNERGLSGLVLSLFLFIPASILFPPLVLGLLWFLSRQFQDPQMVDKRIMLASFSIVAILAGWGWTSLNFSIEGLSSLLFAWPSQSFLCFSMIILALVLRLFQNSGGARTKEKIFLLWFSFPFFLCLFLTLLTDANVFVPRYFIFWIYGMALLLGYWLSEMTGKAMKLFSLTCLVLFSLAPANLKLETWVPQNQPFKEAFKQANQKIGDNDPVLFLSGFIETKDLTWMENPRWKPVWLAPADYYKLRGKIHLIPFNYEEPESIEFLEKTLRELSENNQSVWIVKGGGDGSLAKWQEAKEEIGALRSEEIFKRGGLSVSKWDLLDFNEKLVQVAEPL